MANAAARRSMSSLAFAFVQTRIVSIGSRHGMRVPMRDGQPLTNGVVCDVDDNCEPDRRIGDEQAEN